MPFGSRSQWQSKLEPGKATWHLSCQTGRQGEQRGRFKGPGLASGGWMGKTEVPMRPASGHSRNLVASLNFRWGQNEGSHQLLIRLFGMVVSGVVIGSEQESDSRKPGWLSVCGYRLGCAGLHAAGVGQTSCVHMRLQSGRCLLFSESLIGLLMSSPLDKSLPSWNQYTWLPHSSSCIVFHRKMGQNVSKGLEVYLNGFCYFTISNNVAINVPK